MSPRIVVVGLGPGGTQHVTDETRAAIARVRVRHLRTSVHPSAHLVPDAVTYDDVYESADTFDDVYIEITNRLLAAAQAHGEVLYAVPGSPLILERTVRHLRERTGGAADAVEPDEGDVELDVLPAMSFLDLAWARLGLDPIEAGVRLVDGHDFAISAAGERGPLLVAHTHANWVLSDIKLAVEDATGDEAVTILHALGTDDERIIETTWAQLDQTIDADHLTSIYIPELAAPVGAGYVRFHQLTRTLREQCPWDIEQTHATLIPHLLEETYEVVDALQALDESIGQEHSSADDDLIEELGDLLFQIEFHATIAEQEGRFTIADVTQGIHDKLVRRHPHVFGPADGDMAVADDTATVLDNWDDIKRVEKGRTSVFDGIPRSLPSLTYAQKVGKKASKVGFDWPHVSGAFAKIAEEAGELDEAIARGDDDHTVAELGDLLFAVVNVARHLGIDAELALRTASDKFRRRFEDVERLAREQSIELRDADLVQLDRLWDEVKRSEPSG
jgi:tetrapyrrole methylase family protein/MazG family protein